MTCIGAMLIAMLLDSVIGWPTWLYKRIGHPVTWIGTAISFCDRTLNLEANTDGQRRALGTFTAATVITTTAIFAYAIEHALPRNSMGILLIGILAWPLLAIRSLYEHVANVAEPLAADDLAAARHAVSMIVGRDTSSLDATGISRAAIESLAENTSDGVAAPLFWGAALGLPGIAAYKAINTLDSMIGHRTSQHEAFGWAAARIDDVANYLPARSTALLFAIASRKPHEALATAFADAGKHRSPNAGWPEAAMAGALGVSLSGPRIYAGKISNEPWLNPAGADPTTNDLQKALKLYLFAMTILATLFSLIFLSLWILT